MVLAHVDVFYIIFGLEKAVFLETGAGCMFQNDTLRDVPILYVVTYYPK